MIGIKRSPTGGAETQPPSQETRVEAKKSGQDTKQGGSKTRESESGIERMAAEVLDLYNKQTGEAGEMDAGEYEQTMGHLEALITYAEKSGSDQLLSILRVEQRKLSDRKETSNDNQEELRSKMSELFSMINNQLYYKQSEHHENSETFKKITDSLYMLLEQSNGYDDEYKLLGRPEAVKLMQQMLESTNREFFEAADIREGIQKALKGDFPLEELTPKREREVEVLRIEAKEILKDFQKLEADRKPIEKELENKKTEAKRLRYTDYPRWEEMRKEISQLEDQILLINEKLDRLKQKIKNLIRDADLPSIYLRKETEIDYTEIYRISDEVYITYEYNASSDTAEKYSIFGKEDGQKLMISSLEEQEEAWLSSYRRVKALEEEIKK